MKKTFFPLMLAITLGLMFASCNNANKNQNQEQEQTAPEDSQDDQNISFEDQQGKTFDLNSLKGKVVFINFWATWCPPCKAELPTINQLKKDLNTEDIVFLMVDVDGKIDQSGKFMKDNQYDLPVCIAKSKIPGNFLGNAIPATVILDKSGKMAWHTEGAYDYGQASMMDQLKKLLAQS